VLWPIVTVYISYLICALFVKTITPSFAFQACAAM
jgi:hypothetical protein